MRIRLGPVPARPEPTVGGDHICLVLPALDEAGRIGEVIRRLPPVVGGLPTRCLVVDDGSTDATAAEARAAGAQVLAMGRQQGAARRSAPDYAHRLSEAPRSWRSATPTASTRLRNSRASPNRSFAGAPIMWSAAASPESSSPCDRIDGWAMSTIVHDYNYAQGLTLDLLAKGFVYGEVPITYRFGRSGRSFIRLPTYLRHVVPGVARQLSASVGQSSTT